MAECIWARGLVRIWQQPPKLQVGGPNPPAPALNRFASFFIVSAYLFCLLRHIFHAVQQDSMLPPPGSGTFKMKNYGKTGVYCSILGASRKDPLMKLEGVDLL